jgi:hypothetical protein
VIKVVKLGSLLKRLLRSRMICAAGVGFLRVFGQPGMVGAAEDPGCETNSPLCYKEMRIINNTDGPLYAVIQASIQTQVIPNCPDGGDTWLQAALKDTHACYPVSNIYYLYINPTSGNSGREDSLNNAALVFAARGHARR